MRISVGRGVSLFSLPDELLVETFPALTLVNPPMAVRTERDNVLRVVSAAVSSPIG